MKKYEPTKFKLRLICVNCGMLAMYQIPVRRVFYDFRPQTYDPHGNWVETEHSHYEFTSGRDWTPVICAQCSVPMLVRTPLNISVGPPMAYDTQNIPS